MKHASLSEPTADRSRWKAFCQACAICLSRAKTPSRINSLRRLRIVVAEQVVSETAW